VAWLHLAKLAFQLHKMQYACTCKSFIPDISIEPLQVHCCSEYCIDTCTVTIHIVLWFGRMLCSTLLWLVLL